MSPHVAARLSLAAAVLSLVASPAGAVDLINKPLNDIDYGWNSNRFGSMQQAVDEVVLAAPGVASGATWYGFERSESTSAPFQINVFADVAGRPADSPFYSASIPPLSGLATGQSNQFGYALLEYSSPIPPLALGAGTRYWLMIASTESSVWTWSHSNAGAPGNDEFHRDGDPDGWRSLIGLGYVDERLEHAFRLQGVPEPSTGALLLIAAAAGLGCRRAF